MDVSRGRSAGAATVAGAIVGVFFVACGIDDQLDRCEELQESVSYSDEEDHAFAAWRRFQVETAREAYPKNSELALAWSERRGRSTDGEGHYHE